MSIRHAVKHLVLRLPPIRRLLEQRDEFRALAGALSKKLALERLALEREQSLNSELKEENWTLHRDLDWLRTTEGLVYRMSLFGLGESDFKSPGDAPSPKHVIDDRFRKEFGRVLQRTMFAHIPSSQRELAHHQANVYDHIEGRYQMFASNILPWIRSVAPDMRNMTAIEIGSGTGASSLAFASEVKRLVCFEIDAPAVAAARERLAWFGQDNVEFVETPFVRESEFVAQGRRAHLVVLCAVLEHMTLDEAVEALRAAWECLQPGGLMLVADTPNRFSPFDGHTALLPLFSTLPRELKKAYAQNSPRSGFREAIANADPKDADKLLTRWGSGVSYHELEVALGANIHDHIVLDGYEPVIQAISSLNLGDAITRFIFDRFEIKAHRAFTRTNLYFVLRKPSPELPVDVENLA